MYKSTILFCVGLVGLLLLQTPCLAHEGHDHLFEVETALGTMACLYGDDGVWVGGQLSKAGDFQSFEAAIRKLQLRKRTVKTLAGKRRVSRQLRRLRTFLALAKVECTYTPPSGDEVEATPLPTIPSTVIPGDGAAPVVDPTPTIDGAGTTPSATPVPTPTLVATVAPTATKVSGSSTFDAQGNMTTLGKSHFEVPLALSANITRGEAVFNKFQCGKCHVAPSHIHFPSVRTSVAKAPMNISSGALPDKDLADLVAYLNRMW